MTFTFKLARRLALAHIASIASLAGAASLALYAGACAPGQPLEGGLEPPPDSVLAVHTYPDSVTLHQNEFVDFVAVADLRGGGNGNVSVDWTAEGGTITASGRYTAGSDTGTKKIIGRYRNGKADTSTVTISGSPGGPVLTLINVTPSTAALLPGASQQFSAVGVMSDGSNSAVGVNWSATGGTVDANGFYFAPQAAGSYLVVAVQQGGSLADTARVTVTVPPPTLVAVELTPPTTSLQFGQTQQFAAVGRLSDNSTTAVAVTWSATGGTVNSNGLYTAGNTAGSFRVIAASANGLADTSSVTVSAPTISSITLTPATASLQSGQTQQFSVSAALSNGGTQANPPVTWVATGGAINASGLYTAGATAGTFRVIATSQNGRADTSSVTVALPTITAITVTPASVSLNAGQTQQFTATATLSNGGTQSGPAVTWTATGGTVTTGGLYTAGSTAGTFRVIATSGNGRADTSAIAISTPTITALNLTPATVSLAPSATQQFSVSATLSNGSTSNNPAVTWSATGGTVSSGGLYTAGSTAGSFRVIAAAANGVADTSAVTIATPTVTGIVVAPATVSVTAGQAQQFTASATLSNGGTQTNPAVTWSATGGTINSTGLYTAGTTTGSFRVIAVQASGTLADTASVTVTAAGTGPTPNRPASYTRTVTNYDFTEAPPTTSTDQCFGSAGWCMIGGGTDVVRKLTDATAPNADKTVWEQVYAPGSGGGNAAGIIYRNDAGVRATKLYASVWIWYSPGFEWNQISTKFLYWEDGNILLQADHNGVPLSMYIGAPGYDVVYDPNVCTIPPLSAFEGRWHQIEWQVERGSPGLLRVWLDGQLCSDYRVNVPTISNSAEFNLNSTWGGGGTRLLTSYRRVDHILIATP